MTLQPEIYNDAYATIAKRFTFDAAHRLDYLPEGHKCGRLHGHTYELELVLAGPVDDKTGFVIDYADIADVVQKLVLDRIDHHLLNEVVPQPSTERLVRWVIVELDKAEAFHRRPFDRDDVEVMDVFTGKLRNMTVVEKAAHKTVTLLERVTLKESSSTWCEITVQQLFAQRRVKHQSFSAAYGGWIL